MYSAQPPGGHVLGKMRAYQIVQPSTRSRMLSVGMVCYGNRSSQDNMVILAITIDDEISHPKTLDAVCVWLVPRAALGSDPVPTRWFGVPPAHYSLKDSDLATLTINIKRWLTLVMADPESYRTMASAALIDPPPRRRGRQDARSLHQRDAKTQVSTTCVR